MFCSGVIIVFCLKKSVSIGMEGTKSLHIHWSITIKTCDKYMKMYLSQVNSKQT